MLVPLVRRSQPACLPACYLLCEAMISVAHRLLESCCECVGLCLSVFVCLVYVCVCACLSVRGRHVCVLVWVCLHVCVCVCVCAVTPEIRPRLLVLINCIPKEVTVIQT